MRVVYDWDRRKEVKRSMQRGAIHRETLLRLISHLKAHGYEITLVNPKGKEVGTL